MIMPYFRSFSCFFYLFIFPLQSISIIIYYYYYRQYLSRFCTSLFCIVVVPLLLTDPNNQSAHCMLHLIAGACRYVHRGLVYVVIGFYFLFLHLIEILCTLIALLKRMSLLLFQCSAHSPLIEVLFAY